MVSIIGGTLLLAGCASSANASVAGTKPTVVVVGDSITVSSSIPIHRVLDPTYQVEMSARLGQRIDQMLPALRTDLKVRPSAVIENLGTNDTIQDYPGWTRSWDELISMTRDVPCVVLTTVNELPDEIGAGKQRHVTVAADINDRIKALAASDPGKYHVVDWNRFVRSLTLGNFLHYLVPDLVHPEAGGRQWIAEQDKAALQRCGSGGSS